jgi:uncharacterized protein YdhG (YjbR/CyaY superfamily)
VTVPKTATKKPVKAKGLTADERAAMKERMQDTEGEEAVLAKIEELNGPDRAIAKRIHAIVRENAPELAPKTWYGMPAYAKGGKAVCFFQAAAKFKARYATIGFNDTAHLDEGDMWPVAFAVKELTPGVEQRIAALVKKAVS